MSERVAFIHIPKTAGSTFVSILHKIYPREKRFKISAGNSLPASFQYEVAAKSVEKLDWEIVKKIQLLYGHMPFVINNKTKDFKFITILRDPIERVISDYYYVKSTPANPLHLLVKDFTLIQYITNKRSLHLDNLQTRLLSGRINGKLKEIDLKIAIENLNTRFVAVGITEYFELSLILFKKQLKWHTLPDFVNQNTGKSKPKSLNDHESEVVKQYNQFDRKLYDFYLKKFLMEVRNKDDSLEFELKKMSLKNSIKKSLFVPIIRLINLLDH